MQENDTVSIDPLILQDQSYKSKHFIFERILKENELGYIRNMDLQKSKQQFNNHYWVNFTWQPY